jgi:PAS domain S-box-containing protein
LRVNAGSGPGGFGGVVEAQVEQLLEAAPDAMVGVDESGRIVFVNRQVQRMFGYTAAELVGERVEVLVPERFRAAHVTHRAGYFADPRTRPMGASTSLLGLRRDGTEFPADISLSSIDTGTGTLAIAAIRDITSRRSAEHMFEQLLEAAPDAIVGVDESGRIVLVNRQVERVFGYGRDEIVGQLVELLVPERFHTAHVRHRAGYFADPRTRPMGANLSLFGLRKGGTEFPAEISLSSIETESGTLAITAIRDVTERLVAESVANDEIHRRAIVAAMLQAEEAERARIATALHDDTIQVMTASLIALDRALAAVADLDDAAAVVRRARTTIEQATERTRRLTFELRPAVLHERGMAPAITAMVEQAGREIGADVSVIVPRKRFDWAIEELVYRTVQEAIANVRKHSRASHVSVTIARRRRSLAGLVADDGKGFAVAQTSRRPDRVLHFGLETMVERVRLAGGDLEIDSEPGAGTRILFDIPIGQEADSAA